MKTAILVRARRFISWLSAHKNSSLQNESGAWRSQGSF